MVAGLNTLFPPEVATAVVSCARSLRGALPEDDLSVNTARTQISGGTWQEQQRVALIMGLVVSLRKPRDSSPTPVCWPEP